MLCLAAAIHNLKWLEINYLFNLRPSIYKS